MVRYYIRPIFDSVFDSEFNSIFNSGSSNSTPIHQFYYPASTPLRSKTSTICRRISSRIPLRRNLMVANSPAINDAPAICAQLSESTMCGGKGHSDSLTIHSKGIWPALSPPMRKAVPLPRKPKVRAQSEDNKVE